MDDRIRELNQQYNITFDGEDGEGGDDGGGRDGEQAEAEAEAQGQLDWVTPTAPTAPTAPVMRARDVMMNHDARISQLEEYIGQVSQVVNELHGEMLRLQGQNDTLVRIVGGLIGGSAGGAGGAGTPKAKVQPKKEVIDR